MKNLVLNKFAIFNEPKWRIVLSLGFMMGFLFISNQVFATDLLAGFINTSILSKMLQHSSHHFKQHFNFKNFKLNAIKE